MYWRISDLKNPNYVCVCKRFPVFQEIPLQTEEHEDGYVLLLVILSIFLVGSLIIVSFLVIACRYRSRGGCSR